MPIREKKLRNFIARAMELSRTDPNSEVAASPRRKLEKAADGAGHFWKPSEQSLFEAMACRSPVVLGRLDAYTEAVSDGESALLVDLGPQAIGERIAEEEN